MSHYHEFEPFVEEFMDYGLGYGLLANFGSSILGIVAYVLTSLALYTIAQRRGIKNPWLSWIPVANCWIVGSLSDQYRYVVKGEVKNKRKILLILNIILSVLYVGVFVVAALIIGGAIGAILGGEMEEVILNTFFAPAVAAITMTVPLIGVGIAIKVVHFMAMYDIYTSCTPNNNVIFLVLSIIFSITEPFFLFFTRNRDDGMPPRKQEPVYTPPQEPWNNTEYL